MTASPYQWSSSYVWSIEKSNLLGAGVTSYVYQGKHKEKGDSVAIKTFNYPHDSRIELESNVLQALNHENIVKILAVEHDCQNNPIIVMELCSGGCLFSILEDPENHYGLCEEELLAVIRDVAAGMNHLREKKVAHRDLKPGNIMRVTRNSNGVPGNVYKLTDFGAATFLREDQSFQSLHGTPEYLFPLMYQRAVLREGTTQSFKSTVDLWSIGATFYHAATGQLPFQPFDGRKNPDLMFKIIEEKRCGVISGRQYFKNGPIHYSNHLPNECQLSQDCKDLLEPILAGIMEVNTERAWGFDKFFESVQNMLKKVIIHVFVLRSGVLDRLYMNSLDTQFALKSRIHNRFNINNSFELSFLYNNSLIQPSTQTMSAFPPTSPDNPIVVLIDTTEKFCLPQEVSIVNAHSYQDAVSIHDQIAKSKVICADLHRINTHVKNLHLKYTHTKNAIDTLISLNGKEIKEPQIKAEQLIQASQTITTLIHFFREHDHSISRIVKEMFRTPELVERLSEMNRLVEDVIRKFEEDKKTLSELIKQVDALKEDQIVNNRLLREWKTNEPRSECTLDDVKRMGLINHDAREIFGKICRQKLQNKPQCQFANMDQKHYRQKMISLYNEAILLMHPFKQNFRDWHEHAGNLFLDIVEVNKETSELNRQLSDLHKEFQSLTKDIVEAREKYQEIFESSFMPSMGKMFSRMKEEQKRLRKSVKEISKELIQTDNYLSHNSVVLQTISDLQNSGAFQGSRQLSDQSVNSGNVSSGLED